MAATTKSAPRKRVPAAERRDALIEAAIHHFAHGGPLGTKVSAIAADVGVAQPYVFSLFPTKRDLLSPRSTAASRRSRRSSARAAADFDANGPQEPEEDKLNAIGHGYMNADRGQPRPALPSSSRATRPAATTPASRTPSAAITPAWSNSPRAHRRRRRAPRRLLPDGYVVQRRRCPRHRGLQDGVGVGRVVARRRRLRDCPRRTGPFEAGARGKGREACRRERPSRPRPWLAVAVAETAGDGRSGGDRSSASATGSSREGHGSVAEDAAASQRTWGSPRFRACWPTVTASACRISASP